MAEVIQLEFFKRKQAAARGFKSWSRRFGDKLDEHTRLFDLSDEALLFLISPGDQNIFALYELVMGVKNLGTASDFFHLDKQYPILKRLGPVSIPTLNQSHPKYQVYKGLPELEKETFLRKQIPEAINAFGKRLQD
jgi:hypothetical protein